MADVTPINVGTEARPTPNPNVLIELGYAIKTLDWLRIVMVMNTAYGRPEELPFDLRGHRVLVYSSLADATDRATERKKLQAQLKQAVLAVLRLSEKRPSASAFELGLARKNDGITSELHNYLLEATLTNRGTKIARNWVITVEMPRRVLRPNQSHFHLDETLSDARRAFFRFDYTDTPLRGKALDPNNSERRAIPYHMNNTLHRDEELRAETVVMKAYVNDELIGEISKPFWELQDF